MTIENSVERKKKKIPNLITSEKKICFSLIQSAHSLQRINGKGIFMNKSESNILIMMTMMFVCCAYTTYVCVLTIATNILCVRKNSIFKYSSFFFGCAIYSIYVKKKIDFCHFIDGTNV